MAGERLHCEYAGCDDNGGEGFANAIALRGHRLGKHTQAEECPVCHKPYKDLAQHLDRAHPTSAGGGEPSVDAGAAPPAGAVPLEEEAPAERRPTSPSGSSAPPPPRGTLRDRVRARVWGGGPADPPPGSAGPSSSPYAGPKEKAPKRSGGVRFSTAPIWSMVWGGTGRRLERTGVDVPVGRVLQFQEPMAGDIIDRLIARTWVDRILQPFASKTEDLEALYALIGLPAAVAMMERSEEAFATMRPMVESMIRANLTNMAPVVKKHRQEARKFAEAVAELDMNLPSDPTTGEPMDPVDGLLWSIFMPPPGTPAPPGVDNEPAPVPG